MMFMQGDFGRVVKVFGVLMFGFVSYTRFTSATPLLTFSVVVLAILAIAAVRASATSTLKRLDFIRANEFANPDDFVRRAKSLHIAEIVVAILWVIWLGRSFGEFDWVPIALVVTVAVFAFIQRWRLTKMSQPRNVWER